jgi:hypothetical protein
MGQEDSDSNGECTARRPAPAVRLAERKCLCLPPCVIVLIRVAGRRSYNIETAVPPNCVSIGQKAAACRDFRFARPVQGVGKRYVRFVFFCVHRLCSLPFYSLFSRSRGAALHLLQGSDCNSQTCPWMRACSKMANQHALSFCDR